MKQIAYIVLFLLSISSCIFRGDSGKSQPEKQISFALENKTYSYYVEQARLWWKEIEKDSTSEESWFNYYRACRNAQGTVDWREDFVEESPYLRLGNDIVKLMELNIPNTFIYNYVKGSTGAVDPSNGRYLLKAYEMNPDFPGIQAAIVTYAVSTHNPVLRKEANRRWNKLDYMNPGLILYSRNLLRSIEPNAIVLTQYDNDSYPAWILQDAYGLKQDVLVLNIDFLLLEAFREKIFKELKIPPFRLDSVDVDEYRQNWKNIVQHFLGNYSNERPLYIGLTVSPEWYQGFEDNLHLHGLTYKFTTEGKAEPEVNKMLYEEVWNLDSVNIDYEGYDGQKNVIEMNAYYLKPLKAVYENYLESNESNEAEIVRRTAKEIAIRTDNEELIEKTDSLFMNR